MISVDRFLDRMPGPQYNCLDFSREVWLALTGEDITERLTGLLGAFTERRMNLSGLKAFKRLKEPCEPCIAVLQRRPEPPHIGIFIRGRILHMHTGGVEFQLPGVVAINFRSLKFYR